MDKEDAKKILSTEDYVIIAVAMIISAGIGLYFRLSGGKQKTKVEYLLAGRNMSVLPVSFSIMATFMSTATMMGMPTEMYLYGTHMAFMNVGIIIGVVAASYIFTPVYFNANVTTSYEYIEKRFGSLARTLCSLGFTIQATLYLGIILYTPALALSAVTNLSTWSSVITIGTVCTFYCTLGGMKAVLWTDVFQALLMFACLFTIIAKGFIDLGGFHEIFKIASEGGRLIVPSTSASFSLRYTIWNILLQAFFMCCFTYGTSQLQVQRLLSVKNSTRARKAIFGSLPLVVSFHLMCCLCGVIIFATYSNCDPLSMPGTPIQSADQLMPYYIMDRLREFPGLPGLCICGIFAASLSTVSSFIQTLTVLMPYYIMDRLREFPGLPGLCICGIFAASLSTVSSFIQTLTVVTIEDFLNPFCSIWKIQIFKSTFSAKALTCFFGALGILLAFLVAAMGNVVEVTIAVFGLLGGPLLGLFFLAVLTQTANEKGVIVGMTSSFAVVTWLTFGPLLASTHGKLPLSNSGCLVSTNMVKVSLPVVTSMNEIANTTESSHVTTISLNSTESKTLHFSHMWITPTGVVISFILGYTCSLFIKYVTGNDDQVNPQLLSPVWHFCIGKRRKMKPVKNQEQEMDVF